MQRLPVGACLKHLVANDSETLRNTMNSVVDEATLRELYLLPFEIATTDSDPWTMMAAYNDVNGVPATEQRHVIDEHLARLAAAGMTVLTNRDRALPLDAGRTVALIGRHAVETSTMGGVRHGSTRRTT